VKRDIKFVPDEWLLVKAASAEKAREFFGAPPDWPVKFAGFDQRSPGRIWKVLAKGLRL
jgi:hypothetical protein